MIICSHIDGPYQLQKFWSTSLHNEIAALSSNYLNVWCNIVFVQYSRLFMARIYKKVGHFCPQTGLINKVNFLDSQSGHAKFMWGSCEAHVRRKAHVMIMWWSCEAREAHEAHARLMWWAECPMEFKTHYSSTNMICFLLSKASSKATIRGCTNWWWISNSQVARSWLSGEEKGINLAANCLSVVFSVHCLTTANMPLWDGERKSGRVEEGKRGRERERERERGGGGKEEEGGRGREREGERGREGRTGRGQISVVSIFIYS